MPPRRRASAAAETPSASREPTPPFAPALVSGGGPLTRAQYRQRMADATLGEMDK